MDNEGYQQEVLWAWGAALVGLVHAFMMWAGRDLMNFLYSWGPQGVVLVVMFFLGARPAAIAGAGIAFAGYLGFFHWWVQTYYANDGLVWLLYLFSLPGGLLAAIAAAVRFNIHNARPAMQASLIAAAMVIGGIVINQLSVQAALEH